MENWISCTGLSALTPATHARLFARRRPCRSLAAQPQYGAPDLPTAWLRYQGLTAYDFPDSVYRLRLSATQGAHMEPIEFLLDHGSFERM